MDAGSEKGESPASVTMGGLEKKKVRGKSLCLIGAL